MNERRLKIFWIGEDHLLQVLQGRGSVSGVPEGAKVHRVDHDFQRCAFGLMCEHESFHPVAEGCVIPWGDPLKFETRRAPAQSTVTGGMFQNCSIVGNSDAGWNMAQPSYTIVELKDTLSELPKELKPESWRDRPSLL